MSRGTIIAGLIAAAVFVAVPWAIKGDFYINMASQVLIYALFALSINLMLGYGSMVSLGHAAYLGVAGYTCILLVTAGYGQLTSAVIAVLFSTAFAGLFGVLSLRAP